jgi:YbbR domain-containing protein
MNNRQNGYELPEFVRRWGEAVPGNLVLGVVSVALSVVIWVAVTIHVDPIEPEDWEVRAEARNQPSKYIVAIDPQKVKVRFRVPRSVRDDYEPAEDARGEVDLSRIEEEANGREEFVVERPVHIVSGHRDVEVEALGTVKVTVELAQTKTVPVQVKTSGIPQLGYVAEASPPGAAEAVIRGTKGSLKLVEYVTADVKLDGLTVSVV